MTLRLNHQATIDSETTKFDTEETLKTRRIKGTNTILLLHDNASMQP